jgi:hypothetical protein
MYVCMCMYVIQLYCVNLSVHRYCVNISVWMDGWMDGYMHGSNLLLM